MRRFAFLPGLFAVLGFLTPAHAEPVPAGGDTSAPRVLPLQLTLEPVALTERKPLFQSLQSNMRSMLSLHKMIETTPLVVGGITVYVEAEAVATRQRSYNPARLTVGLAPDRVVLCGAF